MNLTDMERPTITKILKLSLELISLKLKLMTKGSRRAIAFDISRMGQLQFAEPILLDYAKKHPEDILLLVHKGAISDDFKIQDLGAKVTPINNAVLRCTSFPEIDLFITTQQYSHGPDGVYSISIFHGQPCKGRTFTPGIVRSFDAFFLYGPLHRQAFDDFVKEFLGGEYPEHLQLFEIGYPKSDDLLNGRFYGPEILEQLGLNPERKTILYAPAFDEGASLREFGLEIIKLLANETNFNVIVKLPFNSWVSTSDFYQTGGVDWFEAISPLEANYPNLRLYKDYKVDPLLACADVLVTCISSVSFEFLALNKPVIFIDTPKYFSGYLKRKYPNRDTVSWASRTTVNGGREFGKVVSNIQELPAAIANVLANSQDFPLQKERLKTFLLYNPGKGTEAAVGKIEELLATKARTSRPGNKSLLLHHRVLSYFKRLFYDQIK